MSVPSGFAGPTEGLWISPKKLTSTDPMTEVIRKAEKQESQFANLPVFLLSLFERMKIGK